MNLSIVIEYYKAHLHYNNGNIHTHIYTALWFRQWQFCVHSLFMGRQMSAVARNVNNLLVFSWICTTDTQIVEFSEGRGPLSSTEMGMNSTMKIYFFAYQSHSNGWFDQSLRWDFDRAIWARFPLLVSSEIVRRRRPNKCYILYICSP